MEFIADFHIHTKYSRATSPNMNIEYLSKFAKIKGINLLGTGDFTHPLWCAELKKKLKPLGTGIFSYDNMNFILTGEVSSIYTQNGKGRRIHNLIFAPNFESVERINAALSRYGKLASDGRPIFGISARDLYKIVLDISWECFIVPAHVWTPWFSVFGSNSGFDTIQECFGDYSKYIFAIETGLSSDPPMNWRLSSLDNITLISNSDAHSPEKIGREANVFNSAMNYYDIKDTLMRKNNNKFLYTIEFFPEEGKYHYDGHRLCGIRFSPTETKRHNGICPKCGGKLTIGVMNRVEQLADRVEGDKPKKVIPFKHLVPLQEIIASVLKKDVKTVPVQNEYQKIMQKGHNEIEILLKLSRDEMLKFIPEETANAIMKVRDGKIKAEAGYDGVYGKIEVAEKDFQQQQLTLF
jgi:uncharacterized protein (TIGR00375 family)